jgi:hypothetical protein
MFVQRVVIKNYRCLKAADVTFNDGMNVIVGNNECGKIDPARGDPPRANGPAQWSTATDRASPLIGMIRLESKPMQSTSNAG